VPALHSPTYDYLWPTFLRFQRVPCRLASKPIDEQEPTGTTRTERSAGADCWSSNLHLPVRSSRFLAIVGLSPTKWHGTDTLELTGAGYRR